MAGKPRCQADGSAPILARRASSSYITLYRTKRGRKKETERSSCVVEEGGDLVSGADIILAAARPLLKHRRFVPKVTFQCMQVVVRIAAQTSLLPLRKRPPAGTKAPRGMKGDIPGAV